MKPADGALCFGVQEDGAGCASGERSFVLRLYEAEGAADRVKISFGIPVKGIAETDMLEETLKEHGAVQELVLDFRAFEIKTLKVYY